MKEFVLLFRQPGYDHSQLKPEELEAIAGKWKSWTGGIAEQGKMVSNGQRLAIEGKVLKAGGIVTDGPFVEIREILGSFIVVRAENLDEALALANGCPAIDAGGSVEIRPLFT